jgi:hypothetical protein
MNDFKALKGIVSHIGRPNAIICNARIDGRTVCELFVINGGKLFWDDIRGGLTFPTVAFATARGKLRAFLGEKYRAPQDKKTLQSKFPARTSTDCLSSAG